jgi:hypothetical protein
MFFVFFCHLFSETIIFLLLEKITSKYTYINLLFFKYFNVILYYYELLGYAVDMLSFSKSLS